MLSERSRCSEGVGVPAMHHVEHVPAMHSVPTDGQTDRLTGRLIDRQTDSDVTVVVLQTPSCSVTQHTDRQGDKQKDRQTGR